MIPAPNATTNPSRRMEDEVVAIHEPPPIMASGDPAAGRQAIGRRHPACPRFSRSACSVDGRCRWWFWPWWPAWWPAGCGVGGSAIVAGARLRSVGLLLAGAGCEFVGSRWDGGSRRYRPVDRRLRLLLVGFALRNMAVAGMVLVAIGLLANLTVIAAGRRHARPGPAGWCCLRPAPPPVRPGDHLVGLADVVRCRLSARWSRPETSCWPWAWRRRCRS